MEAIRSFFEKIKTYMTLVAGVLTLIVSWANGAIDLAALIIGIITAITIAFAKAGSNRTEKKIDKLLKN